MDSHATEAGVKKSALASRVGFGDGSWAGNGALTFLSAPRGSTRVKVAVTARISAPPAVVFRFSTHLDHLRFISPRHRYEWCTTAGVVLSEGLESEVRLQQHRHGVSVRFRTVRLEPDRFIEDEFLTWPVKGARHTLTLMPLEGGTVTDLEDVITWDPPWYLRRMLERYAEEQRSFFEERQQNAKRLIEAVFALRGEESFREGIFSEAARVHIEPVVPADCGSGT